ncbi:MAG: PstS family phosphate ABC transporter substrate-binding protein [Nocardioidaceae bacterium]|nr:PstS family phosphate ABC transporter substrate-binding protein [Nocardioidaceae bacterium]
MTSTILRRAALPAVLVLTLGLSACGGSNESGSEGDVSGEVLADGSSTVQPLTAAAGELFAEEEPGVNVSVGTAGTGGGFEVFCQGKTDISNASRPIEDEEAALCDKAGVEYTELQVATDALTVVVSAENDFITCLTTDELKTLWEPAAEGKITTWDQVNPDFPAEEISLFGAGTDSGTFDYFTDAINGEEGASRTDYNATEDDNVTVTGVSGSPTAIGYFGFSYFQENSDKLKAVEVDSGDGCVAPSPESAQDGTYTPLARPLFIYVNNKSAADKPYVKAFVDFYAEQNADIVAAAKFIPLNEEQSTELADTAESLG